MEKDNKNYSRLKEVESLAIQETVENLNRKQKSVDNYEALKEKLVELPDKLSYNIMVPFGSKAFMPGSLKNTNSVTMLLGNNWFAKMSSKHACGVVQRRIEVLSESIQGLQKQKELLQNDLKATSDFVELQTGDDVVEIKEEYDEEDDERWKKKRNVQKRMEKVANETDEGVLFQQKNLISQELSVNELESSKQMQKEDKESEGECVEEEKSEEGIGKDEADAVVLESDNIHVPFFENDDDDDDDDDYEEESEQNIWNLIEELSRLNDGGGDDDGGGGDDDDGGDDDGGSDVVQEWVSNKGEALRGKSIVVHGDFSDGEEDDKKEDDDRNDKRKESFDKEDGIDNNADNVNEVKKTICFRHTSTKPSKPSKSSLHTIKSPSDLYNSYNRSIKKALQKAVSFSESVSYAEDQSDHDAHKSETSLSRPSSSSSSSSQMDDVQPVKQMSRFKQSRLKLKRNV